MPCKASSEHTPPQSWEKKTDAELRALILRMTSGSVACPLPPHCTFRMLNGLTHTTRTHLVNGWSRKICLEILGEQLDCDKHCAG